jgi:hypothetical protein
VECPFLQHLRCRTSIGAGLFAVPIFRQNAFSGTRLFIQVSYHGHVDLYRNREGDCRRFRIDWRRGRHRLLPWYWSREPQSEAHFVSLVDCRRGHLHDADHFMEGINIYASYTGS